MRFLGTITIDDYRRDDECRAVADRLMAALQLDPDEVVEIKVTPHNCFVTLLDRRRLTERVVHYPLGDDA